MLFLLSPAKSLDYETPTRIKATEPVYTEQAAELIEVLRQKSPADIAGLMDLSDALATLNVGRYALWQREATRHNSKPAVLAFNGDVYDGLQARTLKPADLHWAQKRLVILSGLYGALRPLDALQPYRLEMGTRLANPRGADLYTWWGDTVSAHLNAQLAELGEGAHPVVVNLASQEYFRVVRRSTLRARVVECVFEDWKGEGYKVISFFAKRARGLMARHAIEQRLRKVDDLRGFAADGYGYAADASAPDRLVFRRKRLDAA
ncbi:MAG: peroxide stress protein YaaA [Leptothrix sp. (in: b-proteobacteria)]